MAVELIGYEKLFEKLGRRYSKSQLKRLENAGRFPKRVYLSPHVVAWPAHKIDEWLEARVHECEAA